VWFAERRHADLDDVEAVVEVLAEAALLDLRGEVAVRRREDARRDGQVAAAADPPHAPLLQRAQELHLHGRRELAHLVEEERAAVRLVEEPGARAGRAGEGAAASSRSASIARSARYSCVKPSATASATMTAMAAVSTLWPRTAERPMAKRRRTIRAFRNWRASTAQAEGGGAVAISFGPSRASRAPASGAARPSTPEPRRRSASAAGSACHSMVAVATGPRSRTPRAAYRGARSGEERWRAAEGAGVAPRPRRAGAGGGADRLPGLADLGGVFGHVGLAAGGEGEDAAAGLLLGADQPLVLELLERGVDGAGAGPPDAAAALLQLLHDLVAVARLLGEQGQDGGAHVAAPRARAAEERERRVAASPPGRAEAAKPGPVGWADRLFKAERGSRHRLGPGLRHPVRRLRRRGLHACRHRAGLRAAGVGHVCRRDRTDRPHRRGPDPPPRAHRHRGQTLDTEIHNCTYNVTN